MRTQHFLLKCNKYNTLKNKYELNEYTSVHKIMKNAEQEKLGKYLVEAVTSKPCTMIIFTLFQLLFFTLFIYYSCYLVIVKVFRKYFVFECHIGNTVVMVALRK